LADDPDRIRDVLRALCDTFVPAVRPPRGATPELATFWQRTASDLGVDRRVLEHVDTQLADEDRDGLYELLGVLTRIGFHRLPLPMREQTLRALRVASEDAARGIDGLRALTVMYFYGAPVDGRTNPNWEPFGYPGPPQVDVPDDHARLPVTEPSGDGDPIVVEADVCVVGSGSGGGVFAAVLAEAGLDTVVLEAGGHFEEPDFPLHDLDAYREMYWRGGPYVTDDRNVMVLAGATLGGGSTINWTTCADTPVWVRADWAGNHGLEGLDGDAFEEHLRAVRERISVTDQCSDLNDPNSRLLDGAKALGWSWHSVERNVDPGRYTPETAGHIGTGDRSGSKQGALKTFLADAAKAGARIMPRCRAERILHKNGRADGVAATWSPPDAAPRAIEVRASRVVVAGGALETPALLIRSGIGGPAVGHHLRLHTVPASSGFYPDRQRAWWGPPQTVIVDEYADLTDGYGFIIETPHVGIALVAAALPWRSGREHKVISGRADHLVNFIAVTRDRGSGRVTVDDRGEAVVTYPLDDPLDRLHRREALGAMARLHEAAGAYAILDLAPKVPIWRRGDDLDAYITGIGEFESGAGGRVVFTAHQMGTARMGVDPTASAADPWGQLFDVKGVWIGDTSAFPTAVGTHPMLTCMALARRTAHAIVDAS
jgi:choline dehydrogenase-like flavoprotein